jgi:hypothetical protein
VEGSSRLRLINHFEAHSAFFMKKESLCRLLYEMNDVRYLLSEALQPFNEPIAHLDNTVQAASKQ